MKRRSFFGALATGMAAIGIPAFSEAAPKTKVEPFWDWKVRLKTQDGRIIEKTLHIQPRTSPAFELTHDGQTYAIVSANNMKRESIYRQIPSWNDRAQRAWAEYEKRANKAANLEDVPCLSRGRVDLVA